MKSSTFHRLAAVAATAAAFALPAAPAQATTLLEFTGETVNAVFTAGSQQTCHDPIMLPWLATSLDLGLYFPVPGASFEDSTAGWQLTGGATVAPGSSTLAVLGVGTASLRIPAGATATSPSFCVDERYPHFRFFLTGTADADVAVVYPGLEGPNVRAATTVDATSRWRLSPRVGLEPTYGTEYGGWRLVALRFKGKGAGGSQLRVDDVLVDPKMR